jgi:peroxiredoxin
MPEVGDKAPDFALYDTEKKVRKLSEFLKERRRTIIAFFPGAFTSVCTQEMCTFRDMFEELQRLKGELVGISVDAPFAQKEFATKNNLNFPLLCDFKRETVKKYGILWPGLGGVEGYDVANRAIFILDDHAKIVWKWVAPNPGTLPNFDLIKASLI